MSKSKVKVEIYEGDPFTGCCGPGVIASQDAIEKMRKMLSERNATVQTLSQDFKEQIEIERGIVSSRRRYDTYPPHICALLKVGTQVPFIVINGQLVLKGTFPSLEDLRKLISKHIKSFNQGVSSQ